MDILVGWEHLSHRIFYLPYPQPGLILDVCQSSFLTLKINGNYLISHAQIKRYASFISATIFCFLPMLYLKAHKTNGFVLIKRKALETSYSLAAQSWTDEGKLLINPLKLKDVVKLRFYCVLDVRRHLQASAASRHMPVYLHAPKKMFRKQQESSTLETWEETSSWQVSWLITHSSLLPPLSGFSEMTSVCAQAVISVKNYCLDHHFPALTISCLSGEVVICDSLCLFSVFSGCCKGKKLSLSLYSCQP